jgi:hypothetical protein
MKPHKMRFIDESLEKAFNILDEKDPAKKAIVKAIRDIRENCYCGRNVKKEINSEKTYCQIWN